jgi:hypothetical protein
MPREKSMYRGHLHKSICDNHQARHHQKTAHERTNLILTVQMVSEETLHDLKDATLEMTPWWHPLWTSVFVAKIKDQFTLGLAISCAHDVSVDLGHHML